jgi:YD repeat-containing protein
LETYDAYGKPVVITDAAGNATSMRYNALGQLVEMIGPARPVAPLGANGEDAIDPFRNQLSEPLVTSMTLDAFGRAVRQVRATSQGADLRETVQRYDAAGNLVSTTDAEGHMKVRSCDASGRVIRETQAIQCDLGPLGINEQGLEWRYVYDALGQLRHTLDVYVAADFPIVCPGSSLGSAIFTERRIPGPIRLLDFVLARYPAWAQSDSAPRLRLDGQATFRGSQIRATEKPMRPVSPPKGNVCSWQSFAEVCGILLRPRAATSMIQGLDILFQ